MSTPSVDTTRRTFLKQAAVAGAVIGFPAVVRAAHPNSRVQLATVGVSGQGFTDVHNFSSHAKVKYVGFCDIDTSCFAKADAAVPGVPHFSDFRVMFDQLGDTVDAISVSVPDHMHALIGIEAMKRGKHLYCQKPLAHTVWECRQMTLWARKKGVITQMGQQAHSSLEYRLATRLIREGAIGRVKEVHSWCNLTGNERTRMIEPPAPDPVPSGVNWEVWIGSAPMRPFSLGVYHPFAWRDWQDFGGGCALGDFGCHVLDPVFTALGLVAPLTIAADNSGINRHVWPVIETIRYEFPGTEFTAGPKVTVTWTDGGLRPSRKLAQLPPELELPATGSLFIGEQGNLVLPHPNAPRLYPAEKFKGFAYPKDLKGQNHWHRWIDAVLDGRNTTASFDYSGPLAETIQLGNVATRACLPPKPKRGNNAQGAREVNVLKWDAANLRFTNNDAANALLTKTYRAGWAVPAA
ncbi:MAG: Gfo/Idh/MocA family oxidoreductase [Verrucomicrobia bacterium]|nr:Gfo/Idh/MocA family oxidoreductase [Verrucomicrobiota bacterium]